MTQMKSGFDPSEPPSDSAFARERQRINQDRASEAATPLPSGKDVQRMNRSAAARASDARMARESVLQAPPTPRTPDEPHPEAPALDSEESGELGKAVAEVVRLDRVQAALSRSLSRIDDEVREISEATRSGALARFVGDRVDTAWQAASQKKSVPEMLTPTLRFDQDRIDEDARVSRMIRTAIESRAVESAREAVSGSLSEIEAAVQDQAEKALADAQQAQERLKLADLTVDADAGALIDGGDDAALSALRLWRDAVRRWGQVQAVRMWCAAAVDRGFLVRNRELKLVGPPRVRSGEFVREEDARRNNAVQAEGKALASQFEGQPGWLGSRGAHAALKWWTGLDQGSRPEAGGVQGSATQGSHDGSEEME